MSVPEPEPCGVAKQADLERAGTNPLQLHLLKCSFRGRAEVLQDSVESLQRGVEPPPRPRGPFPGASLARIVHHSLAAAGPGPKEASFAAACEAAKLGEALTRRPWRPPPLPRQDAVARAAGAPLLLLRRTRLGQCPSIDPAPAVPRSCTARRSVLESRNAALRAELRATGHLEPAVVARPGSLSLPQGTQKQLSRTQG